MKLKYELLSEKLEKAVTDLRRAAGIQRQLSSEVKNAFLSRLANTISAAVEPILTANKVDLKNLPSTSTPAFRDRLTLNADRISAMVESLRKVADLPDPVNEIIEQRTLKNGLILRKVRAPIGVILMIFESRPNVILEAFSLAFKSGNPILLRGGSDSAATASVIYELMMKTVQAAKLKFSPFYGLEDYNRSIIKLLLERKKDFDLVVPRGGEHLIEFVEEHATMPIIKNDRGMCHAYVDAEANLEMAVKIVANAKTQRPSVCNAIETVLVHMDIAAPFVRALYEATKSIPLIWHADHIALKILENRPHVIPAKDIDWDTEYLEQILNCRVVKDLDEALAHIERYGSRHSETIITSSEERARKFQNTLDAAVVYWNASTRFTDGFEFGLGGELGVSTQKLHVRGPVGLRELTAGRWIVDGSGQIRT